MPTRQLQRSRSNRRIAGVCGGLATFFGINPTLVRLIFVLYLILWFVMPEE
jgi:phage shock protein C